MNTSTLVLLSLGLASGLNWTITYEGKQFLNIHQDPDHVKKQCGQGKICVPLTYSVIYCNLLNSADKDIEIRDILRKFHCGFLIDQPMVCCPYGEVTEEPACDADGDIKSRQLLNVKATFYEFLNGKPQETCGKRTLDENSNRISGGKNAPPGKWPWMALLGYNKAGVEGPSFECGGTLISLKTVMTGAHCLTRPVIEVRLGETDLRRRLDCLDPEPDSDCSLLPEDDCLDCAEEHVVRRVSRQTMHPRYNPDNWDNDVGLLTLDQAVTISDFIRPVCLPTVPGVLSQNRLWFVTGWGKTSNKRVLSETLQQVQVDIVSRQSCGQSWGVEVLPSQVCARGEWEGAAVCEGDSGGPLVSKKSGVWEQGAVVSSGSIICGDPKPSFFTIINQDILNWIKANMEDTLLKRPS